MEEELLSNKSKPEYIICSAIHFNNGGKYEHQPKNISEGFVVCGRRHHNCYATTSLVTGSEEMINAINEVNGRAIQGFLTSKDNFVDRKQAGEIAFREKQTERKTDCLFSEDLY